MAGTTKILQLMGKFPTGSGGDSSSKVTILKEQEFTGFAVNDGYGGLFGKDINLGTDVESFSLVVGETYTVVWDDKEYVVVGQDVSGLIDPGSVAIGNSRQEGDTTPFLIATVNAQWAMLISTDDRESHKVGIYQTASVPELPTVTTADNDKILQVVNGVWTATALADSSVKTYVDEYISSALEGDY